MMKYFQYLLFIVLNPFQFPLQAQNFDQEERKKLLVGTWEIAPGRLFVVEKNGKVRMSKEGEDQKRGTWKLNEEATIFYILEKGEIREEMYILNVTQNAFEFQPKDEDMHMLLIRHPFAYEAVAVEERTKMLIGSWKLQYPDGQDKKEGLEEVRFIFHEDKRLEIEENGKPNDRYAKWAISTDGHFLSLIWEGNEADERQEDKARIYSPNAKEMVMLSEGRKTRLLKE
ncbi:MAG: hypothetical protein OHK0053_21940 [Microscillaceae bacterium]